MRDLRQTPILRVEWQARPGERELRRAQNGAREASTRRARAAGARREGR